MIYCKNFYKCHHISQYNNNFKNLKRIKNWLSRFNSKTKVTKVQYTLIKIPILWLHMEATNIFKQKSVFKRCVKYKQSTNKTKWSVPRVIQFRVKGKCYNTWLCFLWDYIVCIWIWDGREGGLGMHIVLLIH
jgi:hypothetical protein